MKALTGSEKQIAWATEIRAKRLAEYTECRNRKAKTLRRLRNGGKGVVGPKEFRAQDAKQFRFVRTVFETQTSASYWIDRRNADILHGMHYGVK